MTPDEAVEDGRRRLIESIADALTAKGRKASTGEPLFFDRWNLEGAIAAVPEAAQLLALKEERDEAQDESAEKSRTIAAWATEADYLRAEVVSLKTRVAELTNALDQVQRAEQIWNRTLELSKRADKAEAEVVSLKTENERLRGTVNQLGSSALAAAERRKVKQT